MNHKARATIERFAMLGQGDRVTAAVSGGADSVALLDFLSAQEDLHLTVRACHLNHCLRGAESDRDEQLVRTMCAQYGVPLDVKRVDIRALAKKRGRSIEETAREERYAFFAELAKRDNCKIATAHTLSDTAETVIFNLARGTGMTGLCGIPPMRGEIIRPLLECTRQEIEAYCRRHDISFVTDSSNLTDAYTRNYLRHHVMPQLERVNSGALEAIGRMTDALRQDADFLSQTAKQVGEQLACQDGMDAMELHRQHPAIRARIVGNLLEAAGVERSSQRIAMIESMLAGGRRHTLQVGRVTYITVRKGILRLEHREKPEEKCEISPRILHKGALDGSRIVVTEEKILTFSVINQTEYEIFENNAELTLKNAMDYDKIGADIFLRSRQVGDRIRQAGRGCSKSLKKLYNELALPAREQLCVLADGEGVLFAEGAGVDERVKPTGQTVRLLVLELISQKECKTNGG